jgi:hypothetical protein
MFQNRFKDFHVSWPAGSRRKFGAVVGQIVCRTMTVRACAPDTVKKIMAAKISRRSFRVGRSRTGLGLFATKPIAKGTKIIRYWGPKISSKLADEMENKYLFEINSRWTIDGSIRRNTARYVNHACRPNAESDVRGHTIIIRAIKTIAPGDEITYDYGKNYFNTFIKPVGCKCRTCEEKRKKERAEQRARAKRAKARALRKAELMEAANRAGRKASSKIGQAKGGKVGAKTSSNRKATKTVAKTTAKTPAKSKRKAPVKLKLVRSAGATVRNAQTGDQGVSRAA